MVSSTDPHPDIDAVFFDIGGVILSSPFEAFAAYEQRAGLPRHLIRTINAANPDTNAWARYERSESTVGEFVVAFEAEARELGHEVDGYEVLGCLNGSVRPAMVRAVEMVHQRFAVALLTNNVAGMDAPQLGSPTRDLDGFGAVLAHVDVVVESSVVGVRKPEIEFYELACRLVGVSPERVVFLDDLGVNLKPARALGMHTIKVIDPSDALAELGAVLRIDLSGD